MIFIQVKRQIKLAGFNMGKRPETPFNGSNLSVSVLSPTSHHHCSSGHRESAAAVLGRLFLSRQITNGGCWVLRLGVNWRRISGSLSGC